MAKKENKESTRTDITGRMLPHNIEAEQSVLCCAMIDNNAALHALEELTSDSFYSENHGIIFEAMIKVRQNRAKIDLITLTDELEKGSKLQRAGGLQYLTVLSNFVPNSFNYRSYTEIVKNKHMLRQLATAGSKIIEQAFNNDDSGEVLNSAEMGLYEIAKSQEKGKLVPVASVLGNVVNKLKQLEDPTFRLGIPTGFAGLNFITNGLQPSDLILIAARPSIGKTAFGMNLITNIALSTGRKKYKCAVFSLEMTKEQLTQRILCSVAGVSMSRANKGKLEPDEWKRVFAARTLLDNADIYIDDTSMIKPMQLMEKCIRLRNERGLDVVLIDYLQLLNADTKSDRRMENRQTEISEITRYLKLMAKELNVPILLISQLSRKVEERPDKTPMLSDLRESGAIEQDADIVMFIHRPEKDLLSGNDERVEIIIAKHRNGELGRVPLIWKGEYVRFKDDPNDKRVSYEQNMMTSAPPERSYKKPDRSNAPLDAYPNYENSGANASNEQDKGLNFKETSQNKNEPDGQKAQELSSDNEPLNSADAQELTRASYENAVGGNYNISDTNQGSSPANQGSSPANQGSSPADQGSSPVDQKTSPADQKSSIDKNGVADTDGDGGDDGDDGNGGGVSIDDIF